MKQYPLPLPHDEKMAADDFMVTDSNREAAAWLDKWPDWPAHCLVIHGPAGSGKTHLAAIWASRSGGKIISPDTLMELSTRDNKIIAIDNAETIAGDAAAEEALFHLYNFLRETKGFLLLTAAAAPAQWGIRLADLRSRLLATPAAGLAAPDDALLSVLIIKQFHDRQIAIGEDVVRYLLPRVTRTPDAIRKLVSDLDRLALAENRGITIALAKRVVERES